MFLARALLFLSASCLALWLVSDNLEAAFLSLPVIEIPGLLNVWGSYSMLLICPYLVLHVVKDEFNLSLPIGEINRVGIVLMVILAPLLALGTYSKAKSNVASYIECSEQRTFTSRYSSRTYAISEDICSTLVEESS